MRALCSIILATCLVIGISGCGSSKFTDCCSVECVDGCKCNTHGHCCCSGSCVPECDCEGCNCKLQKK